MAYEIVRLVAKLINKYYIYVYTNFSTIQLDTGGTILYIPYCVLQELDKLKQFAVGDGTKVLAVRAIKYLNSKFEAKNKHIQGKH